MKQERSRYQKGSIFLGERKDGNHIWLFRFYEKQPDGSIKRRAVPIGTIREYPTKSGAAKAANYLRMQANDQDQVQMRLKTFDDLIDRYIEEEIPARASTKRGYMHWLENYIRPKWGEKLLVEIKPIEVRNWIKNLDLAGRSKGHIHDRMRHLFSFAMMWEWVPMEQNPLALFHIPGASKRRKKPNILTVEQFRMLLQKIEKEPFRTMLLSAMCVGPRRSEFIGLKWEDFDWPKKTLFIRRGIVDGIIDDVKTAYSDEPMPLDPAFAEVLQNWRDTTEFREETDWVFASPFVGGEMPYWPNGVNARYIRPAGEALGLGRIGWHTFRHTYRTWLDETGAPMSVQQQLMRHADIRTTMNVYGGAHEERLREANSKVVRMAIPA